MGLGPCREGAEGHDRDDDIGDDSRGGVGDEVEGDPADGGEGGVDEAVFVVLSESVHGEEHEDGGGPVEAVVGEEEVLDGFWHRGKGRGEVG